tara:strand:- start:32 stop:586 length:555 start_codon:yes stop_codon:yes gene_type:complete
MTNEIKGVHIFDKMPQGLKLASEITTQTKLTEKRLIELADSQLIPHYRVDNGEPFFNITEVRNWVAWNLVQKVSGETIYPINLVTEIGDCTEKPPKSIADIPNLKQVPDNYEPVVYFLALKDEVVYVGQSISVIARIKDHRRDGKIFDRVYGIPCPRTELDSLEDKFIQTLKPLLNKTIKQIMV